MQICCVKTIILCHRVIPISHLHHVVHMVEQIILFALLWALIISLIYSQAMDLPLDDISHKWSQLYDAMDSNDWFVLTFKLG